MVNSTANQLPTDVQFEKQLGQLTTFLRVMRQAGLPIEEALQLPIDDPDWRKRLVRFWLSRGLEGSVHQKLARAVLGKNFFGVEEWASLYNARFSQKQLREVAEFPWNEDILNAPCKFVKGKAVKDTHFAFLGMERFNGQPLAIMKLQELHPANGQPRFYSYAPDAWYSKEKFATSITMKLRWYLLLKDIVPGSENMTFDEQKAMLPEEYEVPSAVAEIAKDLLVFKKTGIYANPSRYARTEDVSSDGRRVYAGICVAYGVRVNDGDDYCSDFIGVGASRKFPN